MDWNNDNIHDMLIGDAAGDVSIFLNTNSNTDPVLDSGTFVLNTGDSRGTPVVYDWNGDGRKDLLAGNMTGTVQIYLNDGTDGAPSFSSSTLLQVGGSDFDAGSRSAPRIYDWNGDGLSDVLVGGYEGYVYFLENVGTGTSPVFNSAERMMLLNGDALKANADVDPLSNPRSRLFVTDWNEDGMDDMIVGRADGKLELYTAVVPEPVSSTLFVIGGAVLGFRHFRRKFSL